MKMTKTSWSTYHYLLFILIFAQTATLFAREWYIDPYASSRLILDSNYRLNSRSPQDVVGGSIQAGTTIGSRTTNNDILIRGHVNHNRFTQEQFNSTDVYFYPSGWLTITEKDRLGLSSKIIYDTNLGRQAPEIINNNDNLSEIDDLRFARIRRFNKSVTPNWQHSYNEKTSFNLSYEFNDVEYEKTDNISNLSDYFLHSGQLNLNHQYSATTGLFGSASLMSFEVPAQNLTTLNYSLQIGFNHQLTERWSFEIAAGGRYTQSEFSIPRPVFDSATGLPLFSPTGDLLIQNTSETTHGLGSLAFAAITYQFDQGSVEARVNQDIRPTGAGNLQSSNQASLTVKYQLSQKIRFHLPITYLKGTSLESDQENLDRTFYQISPSMRWQYSPTTSWVLRYQYRRQKYSSQEDSAQSHRLMLMANFNWQRISIAR